MLPIVCWISGNKRAEITVRILDLDSNKRSKLIFRKIEKIGELNHLIERYQSESNSLLKRLLFKQIEEMQHKTAEYSGMIKTIIQKKGLMKS